ncbi:zinc finger MYM-type protein 1-like [Palaemon carinicauda]|uniref:zinc finger MYM-type protein 1-like n=1 Tax=Palaemon carinicauda TaxID=392227 RepID=UPI0035B61058
MYLNIHTDDLNTPSPTSLKPICPTRWLTRYAAVKAVLDNYPDVLAALQEAAKELGSTTASEQQVSEEFYRVEFFSVIDAAVLNIKEYFTSTDLTEYQDLSSVLLTGTHKPEIITKYPELNESLNQQLDFFHNQFKGSTVEDYRKIFADMVPEVRRMFPQVEALLRLLLVSPASSCTAERSFSALRRLKTWLRSSMSQQRLNHLMICHVHRDRLATLSPQRLLRSSSEQKTNEGPFLVDSD